ncbi:putative DNA ligase [Lyophyllum shimeji]|uniref:DNA ligase n=1 Tax=Lyophyllum shimeji TaxID=47721 RepID=A0A9P3PLR3_LYOSH|nr:putative DNA ligase [Lyophyllum shimeji]
MPRGKPAPSTPEVIDVDLLEAEEVDEISSAGPGPSNEQGNSVTAKTLVPLMMQFATPNNPIVYDDLTVDAAIYTATRKPWTSAAVPYSFLAHTLSTLSQTRSRITIINTLTNCLRTIILHDPTSLLPALYLLSNTLAPPYSPVELGLGPSIISRSIQHTSGLTAPALKRLYNTTGDVGDVAFAAKSNLRTLLPHPPLLVNVVYSSLLKIAGCKGQGTAKEKERIVEKLLLAATGEEVRFLTRTLSQNLRVGAVRTSILSALARAMVLMPISHFTETRETFPYHVSPELLDKLQSASTSKSKAVDLARTELAAKFAQAENLVKRAYVRHPNYDRITSALLEAGLDGLQDRVPLTVGIPLHPTLGSPMRSLDEIYEICRDRPFVAELKYDGQRAQIHGSAENGKVVVSIFSRHLEDMTVKYPDVVCLVKSIFQDHPETTSFILDTEIVAISPDGGLKSFQELSNRARKDVQLSDIQVLVSVYAFDLMYLDGEVLLELPFRERRDLLHSRFPPFVPSERQSARFNHVDSCASTEGRDAVEALWATALESRCEGLMIKLLDNAPMIEGFGDKAAKSRRKGLPATYEPDKRTSAWLKLKKDYVTGLGDTLDLIPIGAWHGNGRKAQWWSPILLGLWQPESGRIVAVCKCMSGFTDVFYKALSERYHLSETSETCSREPLWGCDTGGLVPEVYFKPQEVWEIRGADITLSPVSVAAKGLVSESRGLSLRFPRFMRVRDDKTIEDASTPHFLAKLWRDQEARGVVSVEEGGDDDLIDVYSESLPDSDSEASFE